MDYLGQIQPRRMYENKYKNYIFSGFDATGDIYSSSEIIELDTTEYYDQPFDINKIQVSGVLIGNKRRAMIKVSGDVGEKVYTYREGDVLGDKGPEIKAILQGGIILVEQIDNAYGQSEYIETVIPISQ